MQVGRCGIGQFCSSLLSGRGCAAPGLRLKRLERADLGVSRLGGEFDATVVLADGCVFVLGGGVGDDTSQLLCPQRGLPVKTALP